MKMVNVPSCHGKKMRAIGYMPSQKYIPDHFWNLGEPSWTKPKVVYYCDVCGKTEKVSNHW